MVIIEADVIGSSVPAVETQTVGNAPVVASPHNAEAVMGAVPTLTKDAPAPSTISKLVHENTEPPVSGGYQPLASRLGDDGKLVLPPMRSSE